MIRVLLAEDMRILADTLAAVLSLEDDIEVVARVSDGTSVVPTAVGVQPDVAVVDIDMPGTDGVSAAAALREQCPGCRVLILTVLGSPGTLRKALAAGVAGFLPKETPAAELAAAIRAVAAGGKVIDQKLAVVIMEASGQPRCRRAKPRCCGVSRPEPGRRRSPRPCSCPTARSATTWRRPSPRWARVTGPTLSESRRRRAGCSQPGRPYGCCRTTRGGILHRRARAICTLRPRIEPGSCPETPARAIVCV